MWMKIVVLLVLCLTVVDVLQIGGRASAFRVQDASHVLIDNVNTEVIDSAQSVKCNEIVSPTCRKHLKYNQTSLPNRMAMSEMHEVEVRLADYSVIMGSRCSRFIEFFVCSMYIPMCSNRMILQPCRRFCYHVKHRCYPLINHFSFPWPNELKCEDLPEAGDARGQLCIQPENYDNDHPPFKFNKGSPMLPGNFATILNGSNKRMLEIYRDSRDHGGVTTHFAMRCAADEVNIASLGANNSCLQRCHAAFYFRPADRRFAEVWMAVWASVGILSTTLTFLTFVIDVRQGGQRFQYPERPIVYLSVCYFFYSAVFLLRWAIGSDAISCHSKTNGNNDAAMFLVGASHGGAWCNIVFIMLYFFMMAASLWWVILCFTWFLSAARRWGHEGVEHVSSFFHVVAWALPALKTMTILIMHKIDGDELTGLCFVGSQDRQSLLLFVILPLLLYLCTGCFFLLWGFCSLFTVRKDLKTESGNTNVRRLEKLMAKIGVFSILYIVPAVCVVAAYLYEYVERPRWQTARQTACQTLDQTNPIRKEGCLATIRPTVEVYMLKNFMGIAVGITSGVWVWGNKKSLDSWSLFLRKLCGNGAKVAKNTINTGSHFVPTTSYGRQVTQIHSPQATEPDQYTYAGSSLLQPVKPQSPSSLMRKFGPNSSCV